MLSTASSLTTFTRLALLTALAASCVAAQAQMGGGRGGMRRGGSGGGDSTVRRDTERKDEGPSLNDRLYELRMRLLIEAVQSPAWDRFQADTLAMARPQPRSVSVAEESSAVQSMQRELTLAQNRYTLAENMAASLTALYAQLQPQQQQVADQLVPRLLPFVVRPGGGPGARPQGSAGARP
ncbi:MAG: hypothetical protein ACJ8GO_18760 [Ramlibacter sp.]